MSITSEDWLAQLLSLSVWELQGSISGPVKLDTVSPTALHRCDVSSELSWAPPLSGVARHFFGDGPHH